MKEEDLVVAVWGGVAILGFLVYHAFNVFKEQLSSIERTLRKIEEAQYDKSTNSALHDIWLVLDDINDKIPEPDEHD